MDPNANLTEALSLAHTIVEDDDESSDATRLAELVLALDQWIRMGGFLPGAWNANP